MIQLQCRGAVGLFALPDDDGGCREQHVGFVQQWLDVEGYAVNLFKSRRRLEASPQGDVELVTKKEVLSAAGQGLTANKPSPPKPRDSLTAGGVGFREGYIPPERAQ